MRARGTRVGVAFENELETDGMYGEFDLGAGEYSRPPGPFAFGNATDLRAVAVEDLFVVVGGATAGPGAAGEGQIFSESFALAGTAEWMTMTPSTSEEPDAVYTGSATALLPRA